MTDVTLMRIAVGGLLGISALSIVGLVVAAFWGRQDHAVALALAAIAGNAVGFIGGLIVPTGRLPAAEARRRRAAGNAAANRRPPPAA